MVVYMDHLGKYMGGSLLCKGVVLLWGPEQAS